MNLDFREKKNFYINPSEKSNYIFCSSIKGIEQTDLILLVEQIQDMKQQC